MTGPAPIWQQDEPEHGTRITLAPLTNVASYWLVLTTRDDTRGLGPFTELGQEQDR